MKASKLAAIISSLSGDEKKQFEKYVISPFFNTNDTLIYLWDSLPAKFSVNHDEIDGVRIWKKLGMRTTYTDDALRKLLSKLNHLIEGFITYLQYDKAIDKHLYFLEACDLRELPITETFHFSFKHYHTKQLKDTLFII